MPSYNVPLAGGGSMTVNASSPQAAADNVKAQGGTPGGDASNVGGVPVGAGMGGGDNTGGGQDYANLTATQMVLNSAQAKANQAYLNARLQLDNDTLAFQKATEAFNETIQTAQQTGMFNGQPTQAAMTNWAQLYGTSTAPTPGQQTLAAQLQQANMLGTYNGQQTLAANQQQFNQWAQAQQLSQQQWQQQQTAAQNYMQMMAGLRGPADWMKYQQVLGSTPGGISDLVRAAAGQYMPGGGATTGVAPTPVTMQSFYNQLTGGQQAPTGQMSTQQMMQGFQQPGGVPQQGQMQTSYYNPANQMASGSVNWQAPSGQYGQSGAGGMAGGMAWDPTQAQGAWNAGTANPQTQQYQGANAPGGTQQNAQATMSSLVAPNQMAPQTWANLTPSQQQMLLGTWESQGYTQDDAKALFSQSLPKYASQSSGAGSFRLQ